MNIAGIEYLRYNRSRLQTKSRSSRSGISPKDVTLMDDYSNLPLFAYLYKSQLPLPKGVKDLTGKIFGRLTVLSFVTTNGSEGARWLCKCACGKEHIVAARHLNDGQVKSCGCLNREHSRKPSGMSALRAVFNSYVGGAKRRGHSFELSFEQFTGIASQNCFYCGCSSEWRISDDRMRKHGFYGNIKLTGVDRVDSSKGYSIDNVVPCCKVCNIAKHQMPQSVFLAWIDRVYSFQHRTVK